MPSVQDALQTIGEKELQIREQAQTINLLQAQNQELKNRLNAFTQQAMAQAEAQKEPEKVPPPPQAQVSKADPQPGGNGQDQ